jgi:hypothetical protein
MKIKKVIYLIFMLPLLLTSCLPKNYGNKLSLDDFESVNLRADTTSGDSATFHFVSGNAIFTVNSGGIKTGGIVCSGKKDSLHSTNLYSSITGAGAIEGMTISNNYGVVCGSGSFSCPKDPFGYFVPQTIMLTNSTITYKSILNGSSGGKRFTSGDWFKVIITGYKENVPTGTVEYYLADFRNGLTFILKNWEKKDLTSLGEVDKVSFSFDSSDKNLNNVNTPSYVCIDNIYFTQTYILNN